MLTTSNVVNNNPFIPNVSFHPDPFLRPKQPIRQNITCKQNPQNEQNISPNINFDFKENSPFQEGIMSETFQTGQIILSKPQRFRRPCREGKLYPQIFTETNRYKQNTRGDTKKGVKRHTSAHGNQGNPGRLFV